MSTYLSEFILTVSRHDPTAQPLLQLAHWLKTSGRVRIFPQFEDEPDTEQAYLWQKEAGSIARSDKANNALSKLTIRPGSGWSLGYWMAAMPVTVADRLSSLGHDDSEGLIDGFGLWTPQGGNTQVVHISTPGAFAAPIGTPTEFLRALSLPVSSLATALKTGVGQPAEPNVAYCQWLESIGFSPAVDIEDALPNLSNSDTDRFRDWLRTKGYEDKYFMSGTY